MLGDYEFLSSSSEICLDSYTKYFPKRWQNMDHERSIYKLFPVNPSSKECYNITYNMVGQTISGIYRVQYPLAYIRYMLDSQSDDNFYNQLTSHNREKIIYHVLFIEDLAEAIKVNCDMRYYRYPSSFTTSLDKVSFRSSHQCILLLKRRGEDVDFTIIKNHYPMYVVLFDNISLNSFRRSLCNYLSS